MDTIVPTARELTAHRVNGLNEALRVLVLDEPGSGGACHEYIVLVPYVLDEETKCLETNKPNEVVWDAQVEKSAKLFKLSSTETLYYVEDKSCAGIDDGKGMTLYRVQRTAFQNGPVKEAGYNGNSHEAQLAILLDRMEHFQEGPYRCHDNQVALDHLQGARLWLHKRTMDRAARGVEGTHQK